nr:uncharacterized protein LOC109175047 [Ipomoea batatas]
MPETIQHLFFECPLTASTWSDLTQPVNASSGFATWLEGVVVAGNMMTILWSVAICWSIWRGRNGLIWNSKPWHANNVPSEAVQLVNDWIALFFKVENASLAVEKQSLVMSRVVPGFSRERRSLVELSENIGNVKAHVMKKLG